MLGKLRQSLALDASGGGAAIPMDSHSKFVSEIANLSAQATSRCNEREEKEEK